MDSNHLNQPDYGTGQKKLNIYIFGFIICAALTLLAFWAVIGSNFAKPQIFAIIYILACVQFFIQVICFLRLNTHTHQGQLNVMSFIFTGIILLVIVIGSLWIMVNLNYNMMH